MKRFTQHFLALTFSCALWSKPAEAATLQADDIQVSGGIDKHRAELTISANLLNPALEKEPLLYTTRITEKVDAEPHRISQKSTLVFDRVRGTFTSLEVPFYGVHLPERVEGPGLESWSIRHTEGAQRVLVLQWTEDAGPLDRVTVSVFASHESVERVEQFELIAWDLRHASLTTGEISIVSTPELRISEQNLEGLILQTSHPEGESPHQRRYHFYGTRYRGSFQLSLLDPSAYEVHATEIRIDGQYDQATLTFSVKGQATTRNPRGGSLTLLAGEAAITTYTLPESATLRQVDGNYQLHLNGSGTFPFEYQFAARIRDTDQGHSTQFQLPQSILFPMSLSGFKAETDLRLPSGGTIERTGPNTLQSFVPATGKVVLHWNEREAASSSRLFYNSQAHSVIQIGTGVMRQNTRIDLRIMQGELDSVRLDVFGEGEITRVTAPGLLSWDLSNGEDGLRSLTVRFNQAQTKESQISITTVATVADFPVQVEPLRIVPSTSDRHHGLIEIVNDGAVRLNVVGTTGLSRITPEAMNQQSGPSPDSQALSQQRFAFRHSSSAYQLSVQASMILPEISASALVLYFLEYDQTRIEADLEIEVREAPIRDFTILLPQDYVLADVTSHNLADFFLTPATDGQGNQLRMVFSGTVIGRHQIRLRLERNTPLNDANWTLGQIIPQSIRQLRGHIGVASIEGYRLTPASFNGLSEISTVYFPKKVSGLQTAFRMTESEWDLTLNTEVIPQTLQADAFHMFTLGNGLVRGSSLMHFEISGSPLDTLQFDVPAEYQNLEFTGDNVRNWSQNENTYTVTLQSPIIGSYSLLATFERSYDDTNDALVASGITPLGAATEQGTIVVTSNRQIELSETNGSTALVRLTPEELTDDNRLLIQQPVLAAYQYTERPFALGLGIQNLAEADTRTQVVDRAAIKTRIAKDGQSVSELQYIVKTSDEPHLQLTLADQTQLWAVTVDGEKVVPIRSENSTLIPLPPDGEDLRVVEIRIAGTSPTPDTVRIELPTLNIPVLHTSWHLEPAPKQRLNYLEGNAALLPVAGMSDASLQLQNLFVGARPWRSETLFQFFMATLVILVGLGLLRFARSTAIQSFRWRRVLCGTLAMLGILGGMLSITLSSLDALGRIARPSSEIHAHSSVTPASTSLYLVLENRTTHFVAMDVVAGGWPFLLAAGLMLWSISLKSRPQRMLSELAAWSFAILGTLQSEHGGPLALLILCLFLFRHFCWPMIHQFWLRSGSNHAKQLASLALCLSGIGASDLSAASTLHSIPERVAQDLRIEDEHVFGKASFTWHASANDSINLLRAPAFITSIDYDTKQLRLTPSSQAPKTQRLTAIESGEYTINFEYQLPLAKAGKAQAFELPTQHGLVNALTLQLLENNAELIVPEAISLRRTPNNREQANRWMLIPLAKNGIQIQWRPRNRNRSEETPVYFAEWTHLLTPSSGLVEGFHDLAIRPAQGQLKQVIVALPDGVTINDVIANDLSQWRFDPDQNQVRIDLSQAQSKPFLIRILSQSLTQPLPYTSIQTFPRVEGVAGEVGSVAIAAEKDIQISDLAVENLAAIDLQDFQTVLLDLCRKQFPGATLRRSFRYTHSEAKLTFQADEVAPHISVSTSERLSIGADRVLLAAQVEAMIARSGIFSLSFKLPPNLNIDSITGDQLSHWSEHDEEGERLITLHLLRRWQGALQFDIALSGPGISTATDWTAPKLVIQEANRQRGQLTLIPEQGIRLQTTTRDNTSQIDARTGGFKATGALAFELLNADWNLIFALEQVSPWIEVSSLQDVLMSDGKAAVSTFVDCQIKNTAINRLELLLPGNATNVRFEGDHVGNISSTSEGDPNRQNWSVQLTRRVIGAYRLLVRYQVRLPDESVPVSIQGVQLLQTSSQRGFLSLRSQGRLQIQSPQVPDTLYSTAWSNVPRNLRESMPEDVTIAQSYRIVEPTFDLPLSFTRHEIASVLPAQVKDFSLVTIISPTGTSLTRASIRIVPGSKRNLLFTLPQNHEYWFARVNSQAVSTWKSGDTFSVPLTQTLSEENEALVEIFLQSVEPFASNGKLDTQLECLNIDLPANAVSWKVVLDSSWDIQKWSGDLELVSQKVLKGEGSDINAFIQEELTRRRGRTQQAEDWLDQGNKLLSQGNDLLARNAFKNAYGLTQHDAAFNEDARVQLRTVKTRQAMAGISVQQRQLNAALGASSEIQAEGQQSTQQILAQSNPANENSLLNLADRLIEQHEDATSVARSFDITFPLRGTELHFVKSVQVNAASAVQLSLQASQQSRSANGATAALMLLILAASVGIRYRFGQIQS